MENKENKINAEKEALNKAYQNGYAKGYYTAKQKWQTEMRKFEKEKEKEHVELCRIYPFNMISEILDKKDYELTSFCPYLIRQVMNETITEREERVLELRYAWRYNLEDTGREFNVTRERIRQIEAKAIRKLSHPQRIKQMMGVSYPLYSDAVQRINDLERELAKCKNPDSSANEETDFSAIHLEDLNLSVRSFNCLKRANILNLQDLIDFVAEEGNLVKIRNLGIKSREEIENKISEYGVDIYAARKSKEEEYDY